MSVSDRVMVQVTKADIDAGLRGWCRSCPIALALNRALGCSVSVRNDHFVVLDKPKRKIPLHVAAELFVEMFDDGRIVHPFEFPQEIPDGVV